VHVRTWKWCSLVSHAALLIRNPNPVRVHEAKQELHRILADREMKECLPLVFANKQDLPGAMSTTEVTEKLGLLKMRDRSWYCHPRNALMGDWLSQNVKASK
jgi:ADP-ribosylation factor protein 6